MRFVFWVACNVRVHVVHAQVMRSAEGSLELLVAGHEVQHALWAHELVRRRHGKTSFDPTRTPGHLFYVSRPPRLIPRSVG